MARVLIVDDDAEFRAALLQVMQRLGHEAEAVADGQAAMAAHRSSPADVVFMDMFMPEHDGLESIRQFRRAFPAAAIIGMSGGGVIDRGTVLDIARQLGAARTLEKPFGREEARAALAAVLGERGTP